MKKFILLSLIVSFFIIPVRSQVTIGQVTEPLPVSVLELISRQGQQGGFRLPQLSANDIDILAIKISQLDQDDIDRARGMMVFNTDTNCTMVWNGSDFKSLCGDVGKAELTMECGDIVVYPPKTNNPEDGEPVYRQSEILTEDHYIMVAVNCSRGGTYNLVATTGNGYSFISTGTLLETGIHVLRMDGQGTPVAGSPAASPTSYLDDLTLWINDEQTLACQAQLEDAIIVYPAFSPATFTVDEANTYVRGEYVPGTALTGSNNIVLRLTNFTTGPYSFVAEGNGMRFSKTGKITDASSTEIDLILNGTGTPIEAGIHTLQIKNQIDGTDVCPANVAIAYPLMKILGIGEPNYQPASNAQTGGVKAFLMSDNNFGVTENSTMNMQGFSFTSLLYPIAADLNTAINNEKPDIIVLGYNYNPDDTACGYLNTFIENGGVVINISQNLGLARLTNTVFGTSNITATAGTGRFRHPFITDIAANNIQVNDSIYYGPFSDSSGLSGKAWGEDLQDGIGFNNLPSTAIVYSRDILDRPNLIRHPGKAYVAWGEGGPISGCTDGCGGYITSTDTWPFKLDSDMRPIAKNYIGGTVNNSEVFGNIMAWAVGYVYSKKNITNP